MTIDGMSIASFAALLMVVSGGVSGGCYLLLKKRIARLKPEVRSGADLESVRRVLASALRIRAFGNVANVVLMLSVPALFLASVIFDTGGRIPLNFFFMMGLGGIIDRAFKNAKREIERITTADPEHAKLLAGWLAEAERGAFRLSPNTALDSPPEGWVSVPKQESQGELSLPAKEQGALSDPKKDDS